MIDLRRLDDDQALPQLPVLPEAQHQKLPLSVDWNQLEYALAEFDYQPSQQVQPVQQVPEQLEQLLEQANQPTIDWALIAQ